MNAPRHNSGFSLVEVMCAILILGIALAGLNLAMLLAGVFGVHLVGQEYRFSTVRATFAATPKRLRAPWPLKTPTP